MPGPDYERSCRSTRNTSHTQEGGNGGDVGTHNFASDDGGFMKVSTPTSVAPDPEGKECDIAGMPDRSGRRWSRQL